MEKGLSAEDCWIFITNCLMFSCDTYEQFDMRLTVCNLGRLHELLQCSSVCFLFCFVLFFFSFLSSIKFSVV